MIRTNGPKAPGWSIILMGLIFFFGSVSYTADEQEAGMLGSLVFGFVGEDGLRRRLTINLFSMIIGVAVIVMGNRVRKGRVSSARTAVRVMVFFVAACLLVLFIAVFGPFGAEEGENGLHVRVSIHPDQLTWAIVMLCGFALWSAVNMALLIAWLRGLPEPPLLDSQTPQSSGSQ